MTLRAILDALVRVMAPILSFTADEIWSYMPSDPARPASVHLADFPRPDAAYVDAALAADWERLLDVRAAVTKALEALRQRGEIGHSLEASVRLAAVDGLGTLLESRRALLPDIFIVSDVEIAPPGHVGAESTLSGLVIEAGRAGGQKCARCWNWRRDVGSDPRFPTVCGRCAGVLASDDVRQPA